MLRAQDLSDYELLRNKNIQERQQMVSISLFIYLFLIYFLRGDI